MSSWWRLIADQLGVSGSGSGSWKKRAAIAIGAEGAAGRSWAQKIATFQDVQSSQGSWIKRIVDEPNLVSGAAARSAYLSGSISGNDPPTDIAWAGSHSVAEDAALGTVIGGALSAVDPDDGDTFTFSLTNDASGLFGVSGTSIIVTGVLDFETAASHNITVRVTDQDGETYDEVFPVTVTNVAETPPEDPLPEGDPEDDGTFTNPPIATTVDGSVKLHGKKAAGVLGKFLYDLGAPEADKIYTMHYDPDFSLMTDLGRQALVGFVFKTGNDFHMVGLKGDGAAGLDAYQLSGDNKWNSGTGLTEDNAGDATHGTQAGPNWVQLQIAADGSTYTFRTSADGETWVDEYTDEVPVPFADATEPAQFGPGAAFWPTDTGSFSIAIEAWTSAEPVLWTPEALGDIVDLWLDASDAATITSAGNIVTQVDDKSSNANHVIHPAAGPGTGLVTQNSLNVFTFNGSQALYDLAASGLPDNDPTGMTICITVKDTASTSYVFVSYNSAGAQHNLRLTRETGFFRLGGISGGSPANAAEHNDFALISGTALTTLREIFMNGASADTDTATDSASNAPDGIHIGFGPGGVSFMTGEIGEIIILSGTGATNRQLCEGYLAHKWGLADDLDAGHPYKSAAPTL